MPTPETHLEYAQRVGEPRVVPCQLELGPWCGFVWVCVGHDYYFNESPFVNGRKSDRCPISRLEEWRANRWAVAS